MAQDAKQVTLTIDGAQVTVPAGTLIVNAARQIGVDIPVFCYHPKLEPVGMCRMCLVEVGRPAIDRATGQPVLEPDGSPKIAFGPKLETACTTPVAEGMVVVGMSEKAKAGREDIIEFLLTSHPLDCPVCDKGGECPLQNLTLAYGPGVSRFMWDEKMRLAKHFPLGELIVLDRERCIQCGRCVRFQDEIVDDPVIGFYQRGRRLEIVTHSEPGFDSYFSGNTTDICPVGALTTTDFRFQARPWELNSAASICTQCPVGCNITFNTRRERVAGGAFVIKRALPRQNEEVNEIWMCDKGRFGYHYANLPQEIKQPLVRKNGALVEATWDEALDLVAAKFKEAGRDLLTLAGGRLSNEDLFDLGSLAAHLGARKALDTHMAGGELTLEHGVGPGSDLGQAGPGTVILAAACDLEEEAPIYWLRVKQAAQRGATVIVLNPRPTKLERAAQHVVRYPYGGEAAAVLAVLSALPGSALPGGAQSVKRPEMPESVRELSRTPEVQAAAKALAEAQDVIIFYGSEGLGLAGSQALAQACAHLLVATGHSGRANGRPNNGLVGVWPRANDQGAWELGFRPLDDLAGALSGAGAAYLAAADPYGDDPALTAQPGFLVVQELTLTESARRADVVLPAQPYTTRQGSYTSAMRRVQRFYPAIPPTQGSLPDFSITAAIAGRVGLALEAASPAAAFAQLAAVSPAFQGLSYTRLAETHPQWPIMGREDLYYGGTGYENRQGLGAQLAHAAQLLPAGLPWPQLNPSPERPAGALLAVPCTRLYDQGTTLRPSELLKERIGRPFVALHPQEAQRLGIADCQPVEIRLGESAEGASYTAEARLNADLPPGVLLAPRSFGLPVHAPTPVIVTATQQSSAPGWRSNQKSEIG